MCCGKVFLDHRLEDRAVGDAALVGGEALVGQPVGPLERGAEHPPEGVVGAGDEDRLASWSGRRARGKISELPVPMRTGILAGEAMVGDPVAHHVHADIEQREVEPLAAAGLVPAEQGEGDAGGAERAGASSRSAPCRRGTSRRPAGRWLRSARPRPGCRDRSRRATE